jgi:hypothetical protein
MGVSKDAFVARVGEVGDGMVLLIGDGITVRPQMVDNLFRQFDFEWYGGPIGSTEALRAMKEALRVRKVTPAELARYARQAGVWKTVQPYLEALTLDA